MEPTLEDYMDYLAQSPDAQVRRNAAWILGRQRDIRVVAPLIAATSDKDALVRMRVAEAFGALKFAADTSINALDSLLHDEEADVRAQAARSLGLLGQHESLPALIAALDDSDVVVRCQAIEALGQMPDDSAIESLLNALLIDVDADARFYAAQSLSRIGGAALLDRLHEALKTHHDDGPRLLDLLNVLDRLRDARSLPALAALRDHADEDVRSLASWLCERLEHE